MTRKIRSICGYAGPNTKSSRTPVKSRTPTRLEKSPPPAQIKPIPRVAPTVASELIRGSVSRLYPQPKAKPEPKPLTRLANERVATGLMQNKKKSLIISSKTTDKK